MSTWVRSGNGNARVNSGRRGRFPAVQADEKQAAIRYWINQGLSDLKVAMQVGCSDRTVLRYRQAHDIPPSQHQRRAA